MIIASPEAKQLHSERADALERAGATIEAVGPTMAEAFAALVQRGFRASFLKGVSACTRQRGTRRSWTTSSYMWLQ